MGYVDIHSHILYGLDDGAKSLEESVAMLECAAAAGTTDIVATPHANAQYAFNPELVEARISELSARASVRIHRGCDFHLQVDNIQDALAHPEKYAVNHKNYLLVEFPDFSIFPNSDEILQQLLDAGLVPIVTHPERNRELQRRLDEVARWVECGCCVQVTAASLTGTFGKRARACADELVARGLTHFVASDAHDSAYRPPNLADAYKYLAGRWGEEAIQPLFVDNPSAVLTGDPLEFEFPRALKRRRWYQFW